MRSAGASTRRAQGGYVLLEALACGVPVLTSRVGSVPSLLQAVPEYDLLCVEARAEDLTAKLDWLRRTDTTQLVGRARAWVMENNSLERYAARWNALLDTLGSAGAWPLQPTRQGSP